MERENTLSENGGQPGDHFYHGVISKIFWSNETGVIRSDNGRDVPFVFEFVTLLGAPRQDINFLRVGMRVGFDVGWTSKGLRASVIKIYDLFADTVVPEPGGTTEHPPIVPSHRRDGGNPAYQPPYLGNHEVPDPTRYRQQRRPRPPQEQPPEKPATPPAPAQSNTPDSRRSRKR